MPLTPEAFGRFLHWLSADDRQAASEYLSVRKKLVRFFVHKGCEDPDALFDGTVDIVVGKIEECIDCTNPVGYCYGVARNVWRKHMREFKPTEPIEVDPPSLPQAGQEKEQEFRCLDRCVARLSLNIIRITDEPRSMRGGLWPAILEGRTRCGSEYAESVRPSVAV